MCSSQEQSLDENAAILPLHESSPQFLHCEKERHAVERLLSAGPQAFYSAIDTEHCSCFLSPEEVRHITSWVQDCHVNQLQVQQVEHAVGDSAEVEDFHSTYSPQHSDTPAPGLELGWPEKSPRVQKDSVTVHTSPPAEGQPPVREIIRQHLQKAFQVIAVVTDSLTDGPIIKDLHSAACRGVPVYIILNLRSLQGNFTLNRLKHPNIRVRLLGGKTFCSRTGRIVVGELKDKFLLLDLETVIHGSYSLTWTDAHLHRQLITVLHGSAADAFDREFRTLFAASLPVSDTWRAAETHVERTERLRDFSDLQFEKQLFLEPELASPSPPPADSFLDWDAMGVVPLRPDASEDTPLQNDKNMCIMNGNQILDMKRVYGNTSPQENHGLDSSTFTKPLPSPTDPTISQRMKRRLDKKLDRAISRQLSIERCTNGDDRTATEVHDKATEPAHNIVRLSSYNRSQSDVRQCVTEEENNTEEIISKVESKPSRKPITLGIPEFQSFSSLNDIMRRIRPQQGTSGLLSRAPKADVSQMSRSMMDLSILNTGLTHDKTGVPVSRSKATDFDVGHMTPALTLMQKRNNEKKTVLQRTPWNFLSRERPRSFSFTDSMNQSKPLKEKEGDTDENT